MTSGDRSKLDPARAARLRRAVEACLRNGAIPRVPSARSARSGTEGAQSRLAEHFGVSRQRVHQLVQEIRQERI